MRNWTGTQQQRPTAAPPVRLDTQRPGPAYLGGSHGSGPNYLGDDKVVEGVVVRDDEVLLDVHQLVSGDGAQLRKLLPQHLQTARQELVDGVTCGDRAASDVGAEDDDDDLCFRAPQLLGYSASGQKETER